MRTFNDFIIESKDSQYYAELSINNVEKLYQVAMRAKDGKGLEKAMLKMKTQFSDSDKIDFNKVDWDAAYTDLNEAEVEKSETSKLVESILATKESE